MDGGSFKIPLTGSVATFDSLKKKNMFILKRDAFLGLNPA